jgi:4-amino-4-deoxy-L-arabinose transferase-like glycosyltransferase
MSATTNDAALGGAARAGSGAQMRARSLIRGRVADPAWVRPALISLLAATAMLYLVNLAASGWANTFYSAAAQAGSKSWKAFFFGSFDSSNFITVDKSPAALWPMELSARIFGVNSWSILAPQALEGVAAVALLYAAVRRCFSPAAGLLAGAVLALTPVAALMFRFNNPDALLTLLLVAAAYALTRAIERAGWRWIVLVGVLIGFGFLAKMLQALLVVPGFALVYLVVAPTALWRRIVQLLVAGAAMVAAAGWWVAIVALWPPSSRPYIGGSQDNSILNLIFGYNGLGRLTGNETGSVVGGQTVGAGGGGPGGNMWGPTGITRLFGTEMGTQISWLLPAALFFCVVMLWATRRGARTDGRRAAVLIWGSWLVVTGLTFSFAKGIVHPYYAVALAPAIGALVGIGVAWTWGHRASEFARLTLAAALAMTAVWAYFLLDRTPDWLPWLRGVVLVGGLVTAALVALGPVLWRGNRVAGRVVLGLALLAALAAPSAYAVQTVSTAHGGALPTAGPSGSAGFGGPGGRGGFRGAPGGAGGFPQGGGARPAGGFGGGTGRPPTRTGGAPRARAGGLGGLLDASTPSKALVSLLDQNSSSYTWVAAAVGSNSAAGVQLATDSPVMAIGGFNGTDPSPTLAQFKADVAAGKIHYFLAGGSRGGGGFGNSQSSSAIAAWVAQNFTAKTVGGVTVYDLAPSTPAST